MRRPASRRATSRTCSTSRHVTPESFLALLQQLGTWLGGFGDSGVFGTRIPFTADKTLGDVVDLGRAFTDQLVALLESPDGTPNYSTVQELTQRLVARLGGDPSRVHYDAATNLLTFDVTLSESFAPAPAAIGFDVGLDPLGDVSSSSTVSVGGGVTLDVTFGIDLSPLRPDTTPDDPLDDDSLTNHFFIQDASLTGSAQAECRRHRRDREAVQLRGDRRRQRHGQRSRLPLALSLKDPNTQAGHRRGASRSPSCIARCPIPTTLGEVNLDGFANLVLPVSMQPALPGLTLPPGAKLTVTWSDITDPGTLRSSSRRVSTNCSTSSTSASRTCSTRCRKLALTQTGGLDSPFGQELHGLSHHTLQRKCIRDGGDSEYFLLDAWNFEDRVPGGSKGLMKMLCTGGRFFPDGWLAG